MLTGEPWPERYVPLKHASSAITAAFVAALDGAEDERPLQEFLSAHPELWRTILPDAQHVWCFDRPSLAGELIPDFLLCRRDSTGFQWTGVELESPTVRVLLANGRPGAKTREAMAQVRDWRTWLRENVAYAQQHLGFKGLDAEFAGLVVVGRRSELEPKHIAKYRELTTDRLTVMTYDRIVDAALATSKA